MTAPTDSPRVDVAEVRQQVFWARGAHDDRILDMADELLDEIDRLRAEVEVGRRDGERLIAALTEADELRAERDRWRETANRYRREALGRNWDGDLVEDPEDIVNDVRAADPVGGYGCVFCQALPGSGESEVTQDRHRDGCAWLRARRYVEGAR